MGTFTKSVDTDDLPQNVASHQGLHCLPISITLGTENGI